MEELARDMQTLRGIGPKRAALFAKLRVRTVRDLLHTYPRGYEDFTTPVPIAQVQLGEVCCVRVVVMAPAQVTRARGGMLLCKVRTADDSGILEVVFFNNKYAADLLKEGMPYFLYGHVSGTAFKKTMTAPECVPADRNPGLRPVYAATAGLSSRAVADAVREALHLMEAHAVSDPLPNDLRAEHHLCPVDYALQNIHFPKDTQALTAARRRLVFGELLALLLGMGLLRHRQTGNNALRCLPAYDFTPFFASLPYAPTNAQRRAIAQAAADMECAVPMNRLIEGDVGSGKTLVAAALCVLAHANGLQAALMAPTEILASQHAQNLKKLLAPSGLQVGLLTGGLPAAQKKEIKAALADGSVHLAVGTHALLQRDVTFHRLGLVITDEQHRFGVAQRAALAAKGGSTPDIDSDTLPETQTAGTAQSAPHMLIMSATPIPRTLSLMVYGDLDVSVLDELPAGRRPIKTYLVGSKMHARIYRFLRAQLEQGLQAYVVCPLVESDESGLAAAVQLREELAASTFAGMPVGLLHGKMPPREKEQVMRAFASGECKLLVSTTVIEVGVDVPNATVMVVENAERFGLSQLHQLRGRVGRGAAQSHCILISDAEDTLTRKRLQTLCKTTDGFAIAEQDLKLRGPGDFFGKRQHGLPALTIADLIGDMNILREARRAADTLLQKDPALSRSEHAGLRKAVNALFADSGIVFN